MAFKNIEIGISLQGFPFEKCFYYILVNYFQKIKQNIFQNFFSNGFPKTSFEVFSYMWSFTTFLKHAL